MQQNGDENRRVFHCLQRVYHAAAQTHQIPRAHQLAGSGSRKFNASFNALNGNFTCNLVLWHCLARQENHLNHFKTIRFIERFRGRALEMTFKRSNVNLLPG